MVKKYHPLFQLDLKHDFYANGVLKDIAFKPSAETSNLMRQYDLLSRNIDSGHVIYYAQEGENAPKIKLVEDRIKLVFAISPTNPDFINFTDLNISNGGQNPFYFTNVGEGTNSSDSVALSSTNIVTENDRIRFESVRYIQNLISEYKDKRETEDAFDFSIEDDLNQEVFNSSIILEDGFALPSFPDGKYILKKSESTPFPFHLTSTINTNNTMGVIEVHIGKLPNGESHILNDQNINPQNYNLQFERRPTFWRYNIIPGQDAKIKNFEILNTKNIPAPENNQSLFSTDGTLKDLGNGQMAYTLTSTSNIPFLEQDNTTFSLKLVLTKIDGQENPVTMPLPNANFQTLKAEAVADDSGNTKNVYYSDIYVYI